VSVLAHEVNQPPGNRARKMRSDERGGDIGTTRVGESVGAPTALDPTRERRARDVALRSGSGSGVAERLPWVSMEEGDLTATVMPIPRHASPGAPVGAACPTAPDPTLGALGPAASSAAPAAVEVVPGGPEHDARPTGTTTASDRRSAVVDLMRAHGDAVLGYCFRVLRDHQLAEDVRQQTFLDAFRDFDRFQGRSSRRAWLLGIASHRCQDAIRTQQRHSRWIENDEAAVIDTHDARIGPSGHVEYMQVTSALEDCLTLLSPEVRMTVLLRFQTELTYQEIAAKLTTRADALQMRVTRALSSLRRCLENKGVYDD